MAWISVDQRIFGGKLRKLYKELGCSRNEAVGMLTTLWLWGIDNADPDGLIPSADKNDISEVLAPWMAEGIDPHEAVERLVICGWIDEENGNLYLHDWDEWRAYYNRYLKDKKNNRERQARFKEKHHNAKNNVSTNVISNVSEGEPQEKEDKYGKDFEEFWAMYPRKADKGACHKKYKARIKDGYSPEELKTAAENYRRQCEREHTEQQYIKHGKTFLSDSLPFTEYLDRKPEAETGDYLMRVIQGSG